MKKAGFFRAFWSTFTESVNLMAGGEVVIESMWSPAQTVLLEAGKKVGFAAPKEGMRGWCGCTIIYKHVSGADARRGLQVPELVAVGLAGREHGPSGVLQPPPRHDQEVPVEGGMGLLVRRQARQPTNLVGPDGKQAIPKGAVREGGSFTQRIRLYAAWNTTQPQNDYMGTQWNNFTSA